jgi:hypothetical protein
MTLFFGNASSFSNPNGPAIYRCKFDFSGILLDSSTEAEKLLFTKIRFDSQSPVRPMSNLRESLIPIKSLADDLFAHELYFDETSDQISLLESFKDKRDEVQDDETFEDEPRTGFHLANLHWKTITYQLVQDDFINVEIHDQRNGKLIERNIWKDIPIETRLSILKDIAWGQGVDDLEHMTMEDFLAQKKDLLPMISMFGNERFVIVWSTLFIYVMSFDPGVRFEYDHPNFSMDLNQLHGTL